jgi:hypothetical protein
LPLILYQTDIAKVNELYLKKVLDTLSVLRISTTVNFKRGHPFEGKSTETHDAHFHWLFTVVWLRVAGATVTTTFISLGLRVAATLKLVQKTKEYSCVPSQRRATGLQT